MASPDPMQSFGIDDDTEYRSSLHQSRMRTWIGDRSKKTKTRTRTEEFDTEKGAVTARVTRDREGNIVHVKPTKLTPWFGQESDRRNIKKSERGEFLQAIEDSLKAKAKAADQAKLNAAKAAAEGQAQAVVADLGKKQDAAIKDVMGDPAAPVIEGDGKITTEQTPQGSTRIGLAEPMDDQASEDEFVFTESGKVYVFGEDITPTWTDEEVAADDLWILLNLKAGTVTSVGTTPISDHPLYPNHNTSIAEYLEIKRNGVPVQNSDIRITGVAS